ncbi:DUF4184 family protein [Alienimonas chondri]|uniref:DUF4184 family protein n=1 Tax=Alienimonas chondri TaxID=2681879 RepID=UPI001487F1BC|nr:DUF4184 family protein [Alienimonas chondri]
MPFTPTHVAAILPALPWLRRRFGGNRSVPVSALVIGSMIPDAGVFLPRFVNYNVTHTVEGLFTLCLPLGIAAFCAWEYFLKAPLIDLAPRWVRVRATNPAGPSKPPLTLRTLLWAVALTLIGAASHVLWDSFTHVGRWGVRTVPLLDEVWFTLPDWLPLRDPNIRGYKAGQYGSTFLLLPLVGLYALLRLRRREPNGAPHTAVPTRLRWAILAAFVLLPALAAGRDLWSSWGDLPLRWALAKAVISAGVTLLIAVVVYATAYAAFVRPPVAER